MLAVVYGCGTNKHLYRSTVHPLGQDLICSFFFLIRYVFRGHILPLFDSHSGEIRGNEEKEDDMQHSFWTQTRDVELTWLWS